MTGGGHSIYASTCVPLKGNVHLLLIDMLPHFSFKSHESVDFCMGDGDTVVIRDKVSVLSPQLSSRTLQYYFLKTETNQKALGNSNMFSQCIPVRL
jgi:hypothetical protein